MKKILAVAGMVLLSAFPLLAQDNPAKMAAAPAVKKAVSKPKGDVKGVESAFERFSKAWADGDAKARADVFTYDATLINPFGVAADGRGEIEKLFEQENNTIAKGTTQSFDNFKIHFVMPNFALADCDGTISGVKGPDGQDAPDVKLHVYAVVVKRAKEWQIFAARPAIYAPMPGSAPSENAAVAPDHSSSDEATPPPVSGDDMALPTDSPSNATSDPKDKDKQ
jgi:uncharacterized protein (TIGR02246 family)